MIEIPVHIVNQISQLDITINEIRVDEVGANVIDVHMKAFEFWTTVLKL